MTRATIAAVGVMCVAAQALGAAPPPADHDKPFWRAIAADKYRVPAGASVVDLTNELVGRLASPDSEWRDTIAYNTLVAWIYQQSQLGLADLRALAATLEANLRVHIDGPESDDVFRRSSSALTLGVIAARDNAEPVLEAADVRAMLDAALAYLADERDVRGYLGDKGWAHSAAHTSDLIKFLGRSRFVTPADQARILAACQRKLTTTPAVFVFGEDERMARAVLSIVKRADFDVEGFRTWLTAAAPKFPPEPALSLASLQARFSCGRR